MRHPASVKFQPQPLPLLLPHPLPLPMGGRPPHPELSRQPLRRPATILAKSLISRASMKGQCIAVNLGPTSPITHRPPTQLLAAAPAARLPRPPHRHQAAISKVQAAAATAAALSPRRHRCRHCRRRRAAAAAKLVDTGSTWVGFGDIWRMLANVGDYLQKKVYQCD